MAAALIVRGGTHPAPGWFNRWGGPALGLVGLASIAYLLAERFRRR